VQPGGTVVEGTAVKQRHRPPPSAIGRGYAADVHSETQSARRIDCFAYARGRIVRTVAGGSYADPTIREVSGGSGRTPEAIGNQFDKSRPTASHLTAPTVGDLGSDGGHVDAWVVGNRHGGTYDRGWSFI